MNISLRSPSPNNELDWVYTDFWAIASTVTHSFKMKYVLVSGGVISGVGKGIIASSTGLLLKTTGLNVTYMKIDPYMNIDAGTMSPTE